jgi:sulfonate transport system permease protein
MPSPIPRSDAARLRTRAGALIPWLLPILLLAAWQLLTQSGLVSTRILPTLGAVAKAGFKLALSGALFEHMGISFARALAGLPSPAPSPGCWWAG